VDELERRGQMVMGRRPAAWRVALVCALALALLPSVAAAATRSGTITGPANPDGGLASVSVRFNPATGEFDARGTFTAAQPPQGTLLIELLNASNGHCNKSPSQVGEAFLDIPLGPAGGDAILALKDGSNSATDGLAMFRLTGNTFSAAIRSSHLVLSSAVCFDAFELSGSNKPIANLGPAYFAGFVPRPAPAPASAITTVGRFDHLSFTERERFGVVYMTTHPDFLCYEGRPTPLRVARNIESAVAQISPGMSSGISFQANEPIGKAIRQAEGAIGC
jgi:hypothetical protein